MENTGLQAQENHGNALAKLGGSGNPKATYSSMNAVTHEEKLALFKAINDTDTKVADMVNTMINLKDVYAEQVEFVNEETGELTPGVRIVLIDDQGKSYGCASAGIFNAISKLITLFGEPTWEPPIPVKVKAIKKGKKTIYTLSV